jgi:exoribonuclease R
MNPLLQRIVNTKIQHTNPNELLSFAKKYNVSLTSDEASTIVSILRKNSINYFNETDRKKVINEIASKVNPTVANKMNTIFEGLTK